MQATRSLGLTFCGGGNRAFYQQGALEVWGDRLWPRVAAVSAVSGGAAIAVLLLSGRMPAARRHWDELRKGLRKNLHPRRVLRGGPLAPHGAIYREALMVTLAEGGFDTLRAQPFPIRILCSSPPDNRALLLSQLAGFGILAMQQTVQRANPGGSWARALGFRAFALDARSCSSAEELVDLVLASSAVPPILPMGAFRKAPLLDGCIVDNAPASLLANDPTTRTLVMLTNHSHGGTKLVGEHLYLCPSSPVPVLPLDYTESAPIDASIELGRRDAQRHMGLFEQWLTGEELPLAVTG
jgi:predicted acylesterase/phospholipase RssA